MSFEPGAVGRLRSLYCYNEVAGTLRADMGDNQTAVAVENHPADSRLKFSKDGVVQTLSSRMDTGGNNVPMVFGIGSYDSNAMKSANPHAGIYEAETTRTLDANGGNPACNQGGMAVVCLEGNGARPSHKGSGISEDVSFTLNTVERHAVAFAQESEAQQQTYAMTAGCYTQVCEEHSPTLQARDYKDPPLLNQNYIVRRLTPCECAKLQGFPPDWCSGLETPEPSEKDIAFWSEVFETHRRIMGKSSKQKSRAQIVKWLRSPHTDACEYKMWGNGINLQSAMYVLRGIAAISSSAASR